MFMLIPDEVKRGKRSIMKKILTLTLVVLALVLALASCGGQEQKTTTQPIVTEPPVHTHNYADWDIVKNPTCTENGEKVRYCSCGEKQSEVVVALGHNPAEVVEENRVEATCYAEGGYDMVVYCSECKTELERTSHTLNKVEHTPANAVEENRVNPTHEMDGSYDEVVYCVNCRAQMSRTTKVIDATGHTFGEWKIVNQPTVDKEGLQERYCECGEKETQNIAKLVASKGLEFELNSDGVSYAVTGIGSCKDTNIIIPSTYNGLPVTYIGDKAFMDCDFITTIVMPDSITRYADSSAFSYCTSLKSVRLSNSLSYFCADTFYGTSVTSITIPSSVTYLTANWHADIFTSIVFEGTMEQWNAILDNSPYAYGLWIASPVTEVVCSDGVVPLDKSYPF